MNLYLHAKAFPCQSASYEFGSCTAYDALTTSKEALGMQSRLGFVGYHFCKMLIARDPMIASVSW